MAGKGGADSEKLAGVDTAVAVDLALVLVVDCSSSVDDGDFQLQMKGIAGALRDPAVYQAIASGQHRMIALALVHFSNAHSQVTAMNWRILASREQLADAADFIERSKRHWLSGGTGLAAGLEHAIAVMETLPVPATRRTIDVSGDGEDNENGDLRGVRALAAALDITVNGLPITYGSKYLFNYYRDRVIVGTAAFVEPATTLEDFDETMLRKLLREINTPVS
jgi:hypothetical protein